MVAEVVPKAPPPAGVPNNPGGRFRWSVERYLAMLDANILHPEDRTELIDGEVILKMSQNPPHVLGLMLLSDALRLIFAEGFRVDSQIPVRTDSSVPEPDLVVLHGSARDYAGRLPEPKDVRLAAEVSDSSVAYDRHEKAAIYARAGIAEYWILNVADRQLEIHRQPLATGVYADSHIHAEDATVALEGRQVRVADLLP